MELPAFDYPQAPEFERFGIAASDTQAGGMVNGLPRKGTANDHNEAFSDPFADWFSWNLDASQVA